jgi:hypothetical protein
LMKIKLIPDMISVISPDKKNLFFLFNHCEFILQEKRVWQ